MCTNTEIRILEQVYLRPGVHKRELSKILKISMSSLENAIKKINQLLKTKKSGNQINFFINYSKKDIVPALYEIEYRRLDKLPWKVKNAIYEFLGDLQKKPLIAIIFGSYASGDYNKDSDIDILLIYSKVDNEDEIENSAKKIGMGTNTEINSVYLDYNSFKESFHNNRKEFFKNLKENKIIICGVEWWRELKNEEA